VINQVAKHINYDPAAKGRRLAHERAQQRLNNNGFTDAQMRFFERIKVLSKNYINNPGWQEGRERFRQRMAKKDFTEKQLEAIEQRPENTKKQWASITLIEKMKRVSSGLNDMNSTINCPHCGITTNKGNFKRWHGNNCKQNNQPQQ
jgi:hypothetical protein